MVRVLVQTRTITRISAISYHAQRFLELAGISRDKAKKVSEAIGLQWLDSVGVYACDFSGERVLEQEFQVDWGYHQRITSTNPIIRADQPGWEDNLAVEVSAACDRFRLGVQAIGSSPRFWVCFTQATHDNPTLFRERCRTVGVVPGNTVPKWKSVYQEHAVSVTGLPETNIIMRCVEQDI